MLTQRQIQISQFRKNFLQKKIKNLAAMEVLLIGNAGIWIGLLLPTLWSGGMYLMRLSMKY